ncbi:potassium channel family protein [Spirosoma sp. KCTC 42546]|uniref:potassium channel family protein n=1 Tax=Spirosoma sp. KCTC 42546 TaxID=2520506 RepID=UPI001157B349|nr:potassium channel family protein [Spirosoma sp. KCTC 42546]QDK80504.1 potassium channel family protein [Spirosoma sp. KCTC 42546]
MLSKLKQPFSLLSPLLVILGISILGIAGYMSIEQYNFVDALYMTVISITTAGYTEVRPLSPAGRLFTVFLLISSFTTFAYALALITQYIASGEFSHYFKQRKMANQIDTLANHVILCGLGRSGQEAAITLRQHRVPFIVIEQNEERIRTYETKDASLLYVIGSATEDETLLKAGITRAKALLTALPTDADNVFIVLSARSLNDKLTIISRASHYSAQNKLRKAGANNVVMPDKIGGAHMASIVSRPDIMEFLDYLTGNVENGSIMDVKEINKLAKDYRGLPLQQLIDDNLAEGLIVAIRTATGFLITPEPSLLLEADMKLFFLHQASIRNSPVLAERVV